MTGCCCCQTKSTTTTADGWWCHLLRIIIPRRDGRVSQHCWEQRLRVTYGRPGEPCCTLWCTQIQIQDYTNTEIHKYELLRIHLATAKAQFVFTNFIKSIFSLSLKHTHAALHWYYNMFEMWPPLVMQGTIIYNGDTAQTPRLARPLTPVWGNVRLICNQ